MISDELLFIYNQVTGVYISFLVGLLGVVLNVINIVVFVKLGFSDTTNISLLALTVADIGVSLPMVEYSLLNTDFITSLLGEDFKNYICALQGSVQIMFSRIAGLLTALLAVERFICVAWPLHVKSLMTPRLTVLVITGIVVVMTTSNVPYVLANKIALFYDPLSNVTVYGLMPNPNGERLEDVTFTTQVLAQMTSFAVVTFSTLGLIRCLRQTTQWRKSASTVSFQAQTSRREKQLVKTVILISVVFIVFSLPTFAGNLVMVFIKDFNRLGSYRDVFLLMCSIFVMSTCINSVVNIFVYVHMSSRFRVTLLSLVKRK